MPYRMASWRRRYLLHRTHTSPQRRPALVWPQELAPWRCQSRSARPTRCPYLARTSRGCPFNLGCPCRQSFRTEVISIRYQPEGRLLVSASHRRIEFRFALRVLVEVSRKNTSTVLLRQRAPRPSHLILLKEVYEASQILDRRDLVVNPFRRQAGSKLVTQGLSNLPLPTQVLSVSPG